MIAFQQSSHSARRFRRAGSARREGFALIVSLSVMAIVMMSVILLAGQLRVSLAGTSLETGRIRAQESARLAFAVALGELQLAAGPDQRVTARGEIYNWVTTPGNDVDAGRLDESNDPLGRRFWTGVWDSTNPMAPPRWLVSGQDPGLGSAADSRIIGPESVESHSQNYVHAPVVEFEGGSFAWWIGDEGVKATVREQVNEPATSLLEAIPQLQIAQRFGFEEWLEPDFIQSEHAEEIQKVLNVSDLPLALDDVGARLGSEFIHDLTTTSRGLLVDSATGALRENLLSPTSSDPNDPFLNGDLAAFVDRQSNFTLFDIGNFNGRVLTLDGVGNRLPSNWEAVYPSAAEGEYRAFHHLTPIITEFAIYFSVFQRDSEPALRFYIDVELYNPYSFPILLRDDNDPRAFTVLVDGLPELKISRFDSDGEYVDDSGGWVAMDSLRMFNNGARETGSWLTISTNPRSPYRGDPFLMPGETYRLEDPDPQVQPQGLLQSFARSPQDVAGNERILVEGRAPGGADEGRLNVRLVYGARNSRLPGDPSLFEVVNIPYEGNPAFFRFNYPRADGRPASGRGRPGPKKYISGAGYSSDVDVLDSYIFAFHFRLGDEPGSADLAEFLRFHDLRYPRIDYDETFTVIESDGTEAERNLSDIIHTAGGTPMIPTQVEDSISDVFPGPDLDLFSDRATRLQDAEPVNAGDRYADVRLYDVPLNGAVTVADYRHAHFVDQPPLLLTSPYGGDLNRSFDRFFIAKPDLANPNTLGNENPWLVAADPDLAESADLLGPNAAEFLHIDGAFNVNSTSINAWRAILSQSTRDREVWSHPINSSPPNRLLLDRYFARLPSGALQLTPGLTEDGIGDPSTTQGRREALRHGYRTLATSEGQDQLHQLAFLIVDRIKDRGRPFGTLAEFINSGILQEAIDEVGPQINDTSLEILEVSPLNENRTGYEPTALQQTDLVAHLAPLMAVRSDTFRIRVNANAVSEVDDEQISGASLEAIVQREIAPLADLSAGSNPALSVFGRRFKVLSFSWLKN